MPAAEVRGVGRVFPSHAGSNGNGKINGHSVATVAHSSGAIADLDMMAEYFAALYGPAFDLDARVCIYRKEPYGIWFTRPGNVEQLCRMAAVFGLHSDIYSHVNLALADAQEIIRGRNGFRPVESEIAAQVAIVADLDAGKPGKGYPSQAAVLDALAKMPLPPSIVNRTGREDGGVHAYWLLNRPFVIVGTDCRERAKHVSMAWQRLLKDLLQPSKVDSTFDLNRVLRPAGSINRKYGVMVRPLFFSPGVRYDLEDFEKHLPPPPPPALRKKATYFPLNDDRGSVVERARKYVLAIPGAVEGQHGHDATFRVACALVLGFELSPDDALPIMREWNASCQPPWTDAELLHKLAGADEQAAERGYLLRADRHQDRERDEDDGPTDFALQWNGGKLWYGPIGGKPEDGQDAAPRTLESWRQDMRLSRSESIATPGIYFDGSPPGAGKSHADCEAAGESGVSLTITPSHRNCREVVSTFNGLGIDGAAAYPGLNRDTCWDYDTAVQAINAGLSPSASVCVLCPHKDSCAYQGEMEDAGNARHRVATHARAEFGFERLADGRKYIAIHESAVNILRPTEESQSGMDMVAAVSRRAKDVAAEEAESAARNFQTYDRDVLLTLRYFFGRMEETSHWLADELRSQSTTAALAMPPPAGAPLSVDLRLWQAAKSIGILPDQASMRIVKGLTTGDVAELALRCDEILAPGGLPAVSKTVMAIWHTKIPENATVWFCDGTADPSELESLVGRPILNCTPAGSLDRKTRVVQVPHDVKISSSPKTAVAMLRGLLSHFPNARRVGVIGHQGHLAAIRGTAKGENLEEALRRRIVKVEHFRGGESRGSNSWLELCDLIVILGTPRVPPPAVRSYLVRIGKIDAAAKRTGKGGDVVFGKTTWNGKTEDGQECTVETLAYDDPAWRQAHQSLVVSELRQAIGRGREFSEAGVDVAVVTNENLSLPLLAIEALGVTNSEVEVLKTVAKLSLPNSKGLDGEAIATKFLIDIPLEFGSDKQQSPSFAVCATVAAILKKRDCYVRRVLVSLESKKLVERIGHRGGWRLTPAAIAFLSPTADEAELVPGAKKNIGEKIAAEEIEAKA